MDLPWQRSPLSTWSIVGMNHYFVDGYKRLYVAMMQGDKCIKEEGVDSKYLWDRLQLKAIEKSNKSLKSDVDQATPDHAV